MEPIGLRITVEDPDSRVRNFGFHMNINKPLEGIDFGDFNYNVDEAESNGDWLIEETSVSLNDSDVVYYWYYVVVDNHGYQITDK